jgi:DNA-binding LacI/PurR family transcriptional regulator
MGQTAADRLLALIEGTASPEPEVRIMKTQLVIRESVKDRTVI